MKQIVRQKQFKSKEKITKVEVTGDTLTGRGGMALFVRYLSSVNIYALLLEKFSWIRRSMKGLPVWNIFKQIICFFYDGTSRHLVYFDQLKKDEGYAAVIENSPEEMVSSHQVKRFFRAFSLVAGMIFRRILKRMFIWRLKIQKPKVINLTLDPMVIDNNEAKERHEVEPTYKKLIRKLGSNLHFSFIILFRCSTSFFNLFSLSKLTSIAFIISLTAGPFIPKIFPTSLFFLPLRGLYHNIAN
ncbi:MAG: hypothetical protein QMC83_06815 [Thermodesulfovibrionales bacterium]|nr:hypothetical protein [Thermodesulfovibrionales bacterium]